MKSNNDLLVVRSDVYTLNSDFTLSVSPARTRAGLPIVSLDPQFFGLLKDFEARMCVIPSLVNADSFMVRGDVIFSHPLTIIGKVVVQGSPDWQLSVQQHVDHLEDEELVLG